jgi:ribosomal protein S27E
LEQKNEITPRQVCNGSKTEYLFDCPDCGHEISKTLFSISSAKIGCYYCKSDKLCCNEECMFCYKKLFASHEKSEEWAHINTKNLDMYVGIVTQNILLYAKYVTICITEDQ